MNLPLAALVKKDHRLGRLIHLRKHKRVGNALLSQRCAHQIGCVFIAPNQREKFHLVA